MFELIYRSKADDNLKSSDILDILNISKQWNSTHNITGCLLYYNHEFLQILEGDDIAVKDLFSQIEKDRRHSNISRISENEKSNRTFKNWSMAYHELKKSEIHDMNRQHFIDSFLTISQLAEKPTHVVKLFWFLSQKILKG
ncbi:MAG: BLUF domain-containing protein [Burkholderiales bacterium]|nr:BLUF domain-containing protein [Bacteroidia bacterium]